MLSGFLITSSVLRKLERGWSWTDYIVDRGVRLYVVLLPGLLLGGLWDFTGMCFFDRGNLYNAPLFPFGYSIPSQQLSVGVFLGNLLFLQTRFATVFGSNGPLWSLFNEFWYYVLFPSLVVAGMAMKRRSVWGMLLNLLVALLAVFVLREALAGFLVWLGGGAVALTSRYWSFGPARKWLAVGFLPASAALTFACFVFARATHGRFGSDLSVGFSFALLVHGLAQQQWFPGNLALRVAKRFAAFSYSLYVLHFPFLLLIRAICLPLPHDVWRPDGMHLLEGMGIVLVVVFYAYGISYITERKTAEFRQWVRERVTQISSA